MSENILIAVAWPYANAEIHVGNLTGSHLPGDISARYHRLKGDKVLMIRHGFTRHRHHGRRTNSLTRGRSV
ncbi:MAG: class I tRNA ligase family protein [Anaerolineales bacterium]